MIAQPNSQKELVISSSQAQNADKQPQQSDTLSLREISCTSKTSSAHRGRSISRKPAQQSNLQSYKLIKRQSKEAKDTKFQEKKEQQPPKYPKNVLELNQQLKTTGIPSLVDNDKPSDNVPSDLRKSAEGAKFKKKAMTKQEIIEIKHYMLRYEEEESDTNSMTGSEKAVPEQQNKDKQQYKKSKTEYFNLNQIYGKIEIGLDQNYSQGEKMLVISLRDKCKSVDETNLLLNKRVSWLREEIEVHLQRQVDFQKTKSELQSQINAQKSVIQAQEKEIKQLKKKIGSKQGEIEKLRRFVIDLNLKFENDREILNSEIEFLKCEQANQLEEREQAYQLSLKELEAIIEKLNYQLQQIPLSIQEEQEDYSHGIIQKLIAQNKYLKMENHMLARFKDKLDILKRENKQISNQRDSLKKKIIENLKKNYKAKDFDDSSQLQSLLSLSVSNVS